MTVRRLIAFIATAGMILALAACGGGSSKSNAKTPAKKTPAVTGTITPRTTGTANGTPGATAPSSQDGTPGGTNGGGDGSTQATPSAIRPTAILGDHVSYQVQFTVASDPGNLEPLVGQRNRFPTRLTVTIGTGAMSIDGPRPFIKVTGTIDAGGTFTATGSGDITPYRNVEVTFTGTIAHGQLTGSYAIGTNGALPGRQPITYSITGTAVPTGDHTPTG